MNQKYFALSKDTQIRPHIYTSMFELQLSIVEINHIREIINKGWILGSALFKKNFQEKIEPPVTSILKGKIVDRNLVKTKSIKSNPIDFSTSYFIPIYFD